MSTETNAASLTEGSVPRGRFAPPAQASVPAPEPVYAAINGFRAALRQLDGARTWPDLERATSEFLALGQDAVPHVLRELRHIQSSKRAEVFHLFLATHASVEALVDATREPGCPEELRIALARVLGLSLDQPGTSDRDLKLRGIISTLCAMTREPEISVRIAVIDTLSSIGYADAQVFDALEARLQDDNMGVRSAAQEALTELRGEP